MAEDMDEATPPAPAEVDAALDDEAVRHAELEPLWMVTGAEYEVLRQRRDADQRPPTRRGHAPLTCPQSR